MTPDRDLPGLHLQQVPSAPGRQLSRVATRETVQYLLALAHDGHHQQAVALVTDLMAYGLPAREVLSAMLLPVLHEVGDLWHANLVDVAAQQRVSVACDQILESVAWPPAPSPADLRGLVLLAAPPDEEHLLGARLATGWLVDDGWTAVDLGAVTAADLAANEDALAEAAALVVHAARVALLPGLLPLLEVAAAVGVGVVAAGPGFGPSGDWCDALGIASWAATHAELSSAVLHCSAPRIAVTAAGLDAVASLDARQAALVTGSSFAVDNTEHHPDASGPLHPVTFTLDALRPALLFAEPAILGAEVQWYRAFLASRDQPIDRYRAVLERLQRELADIPGCASTIESALTVT